MTGRTAEGGPAPETRLPPSEIGPPETGTDEAGTALHRAKGLRAKAQKLEDAGKAPAAFEAAVSAWKLVRGHKDDESRQLLTDLEADLERLGKRVNADAVGEGGRRLEDVPLISR